MRDTHAAAALIFASAALFAPPMSAAGDPADLCEAATIAAAEASGVPLSVLRAIAIAESGRNQRPWPWTVNFGGEGFWFDSSDAAQLAVVERQEMGATNIDIGCFQINHRWHGDAFETLAAMFDPAQNATYAARFLTELHAETGSWSDAAAAYHSRTPELADRYRARFEELQNSLTDEGGPLLASVPRENRFPLLQAGGLGALGSLVPHQAGAGSLFGTVE